MNVANGDLSNIPHVDFTRPSEVNMKPSEHEQGNTVCSDDHHFSSKMWNAVLNNIAITQFNARTCSSHVVTLLIDSQARCSGTVKYDRQKYGNGCVLKRSSLMFLG